jgi:hypothetical protein
MGGLDGTLRTDKGGLYVIADIIACSTGYKLIDFVEFTGKITWTWSGANCWRRLWRS